ncbi:MAG: ABC transporter ATP-binding protein/permease [Treponema sp.]|jgi:ABC-type multidrug transport system fused ATPase/permease subunit|nr:ABC transporter ATP-binding protein/permease [Treponema sp.]
MKSRDGYSLLKQEKYGYLDMVTMSFRTSPLYSIIFAVKNIFDALLPTLLIFITADFLNTAISIYNNEAVLSSVYRPVAFLAATMMYDALIDVLMNLIECNRNIYYRKKLIPEMLAKWARLEYRHIENPKTADLINRVCPPFAWTVWGMYSRILDIANLGVFVMGIIITLFTQVWWIAVTMLIASIPILFIATKAGKQSYAADKEMTKIDRRVNYLSGVMKSRDAVEERNLYGYTDNLNKQYSEKYEFARKFRLKVSRWNFIKSKTGGVVTTVYSVGAMIALIPPVVDGSISIGMFIALMAAVFRLTVRLSWGVNWIIEEISRNRERLKDLTEFMALDEYEDAAAKPEKNMSFNVIEFRNVSFTYPGTDKIILDKISFTIENGKHYSFVGVNGAGKTTITKLITGLYTNFEGEIIIDGRSIRDLAQAEIKGLSSVVYQDFAKYYISLYDNIAIADLDNPDNRKDVENALELTGMSEAVEKLKDGIDTPLGKILENGADISGGEWQRVAMARSVLSPAPLKILDEPTAALDPIGESMVYRNFERISKGMTTIFISHRLGSTKLADIIYVLSGGKIIESGSHSALMAEKGVYCEMFNSQAEWYTNEVQSGEAAVYA